MNKLVSGILAVAIVLSCLTPHGAALAQTQDPAPTPTGVSDEMKKLQEEIDLLKKKAEKAEAEKKLAEASTSKSDKEKRLEEEIELAKKRTEKAEADRKLIESYLPKSEAKPLEGKITIDDKAVFESEVLTHRALAELSNDIIRDLSKLSPKVVAIYNERDISSIQYYTVIKQQVSATADKYKKLLGKDDQEVGAAAFLMAPEVASSLLKSVSDLMGLFRTDTEIKPFTFTVDEAVMVSQVAKGLSGSATVYYPVKYPPQLFASEKGKSEILEALTGVSEQKAKADALIARCTSKPSTAPQSELEKLEEEVQILKKRLEKAEVEKKLAELTNTQPARETPASAPNGNVAKRRETRRGEPGVIPVVAAVENGVVKPADADKKANVQSPDAVCTDVEKKKVPKLKALNDQYEKFLGELVKIDEQSNTTALSTLLRAESLFKAINRPESYILQLTVHKAAGSNVLKRNFFTGTKLYHSGGVIASYILYEKDGSIKASDTKNKYYGLKQVTSKKLDMEVEPAPPPATGNSPAGKADGGNH